MNLLKLSLFVLVAGVLGGCVAVPESPGYGPAYYGPSVGVSIEAHDHYRGHRGW